MVRYRKNNLHILYLINVLFIAVDVAQVEPVS